MITATILSALLVLNSQIESAYVEGASANMGADLVAGIKAIQAEVTESAETGVTFGSGSKAGIEEDMVFEIADASGPVILKVKSVEPDSAKAVRLGGAGYPAEWKGKKATEAPTIGVAGVYDELIEGFDDFSRDFCKGIHAALKLGPFTEIAPLQAIEPVAAGFQAGDAKGVGARQAMSDATGATILIIGILTKSSTAWTVNFEAVNTKSGKVRASAEAKLDPSRLKSYLPGAVLYDFKMIDDDDSRRILSGGWKTASNDRTGKSGMMPTDGRFLLVIANKLFGNVLDINFKWQSNRLNPPVNPPKSQTTLLLHYNDLKNWDGVRMSNADVFLVGMKDGVQWVGQESAKLVYPMIDSSDSSEINVSVKNKKVTVKVGSVTIKGELPVLLPSRVGISCINEDGEDPRNTFLVHSCTVKRGSGL